MQGEYFQVSRQRLSRIISVSFCSLWWFSLAAGTQHIWISVAKSTRGCTVPWFGDDDTRAIFSPFSHLHVAGDFWQDCKLLRGRFMLWTVILMVTPVLLDDFWNFI